MSNDALTLHERRAGEYSGVEAVTPEFLAVAGENDGAAGLLVVGGLVPCTAPGGFYFVQPLKQINDDVGRQAVVGRVGQS